REWYRRRRAAPSAFATRRKTGTGQARIRRSLGVSTQNSRDSALKWRSVDQDQREVTVADEPRPEREEPAHHTPQRGFLAEWTVTIILLLFGQTALVPAV